MRHLRNLLAKTPPLRRLVGLPAACLGAALLTQVPAPVAAQGGIRVENVTWVPATQDVVDNCQRLRDTLATLPASPDQVVQLGPGFYFCGSSSLVVPSHLTLVGAGPSTFIVGEPDALGVVHLIGRSELRRVSVANFLTNPANPPAIAVSAIDFPPGPGSPRLVDVHATVSVLTGTAYPLWVTQEQVVVEGGSFTGGDIRLQGNNYTFRLSGSSIEGVDADATITASCHFYLNLVTGSPATSPFGTCP